MTCNKYENALLSAAASNDERDTKLAQHLERCLTCRTTLSLQRKLVSRIDSTLRAEVNETPPSGFLAQLRLQLTKELPLRPGSNRVWHATAALGLVLIATFYPLINGRQSRVQQDLQTPTIKVLQNGRVKHSAPASEDSAVRSRHHSKRPAVQNTRRQEPEVLVPPDEQQAFAQFVACVARRDGMAQAVVTRAANRTVDRNTEPPPVSFVTIADLQFGREGRGQWVNQADNSK